MASKSFLKYLNEYENKGYDGVFSEDKYPRSSKDAVTGQVAYETTLKPVMSGTEFIQNTVKAGIAPQKYNFLAEPKQFGPQQLPDEVKKNLNQYADYRKSIETPTGNKAVDTLNAITRGLEKLNKSKVVSFGAGANPLTWNKDISNFVYGEEVAKKLEEAKQENPNTAMIGEITTSIAPMVKASQLLGKIPQISNMGNKFAKTAAIEGTAGLGYGTLEGLYRGESLEDATKRGALYGIGGATLGQLGNLGKFALPTAGGLAGGAYAGYQSVQDTINKGEDISSNLGKISLDTLKGAGLGALGGAGIYLGAKGAKNLYDNTIGFDKAIQRTGQAIDEYQFPQLREPQIYPMPASKGQVVSPDIPVQYRQPVPKGAIPEMPLALPPPQAKRISSIDDVTNPYYVDPKFRTEVAGDPTRPIKLPPDVRGSKIDNAQSNLKPLNNEGNINLPSSNKNASESIVKPNRPIETNAVWKNQDFDQPVTVLGEAGVMNGKKYYKIQGSNSAIPEDELIFNQSKEVPSNFKPNTVTENVQPKQKYSSDVQKQLDEAEARYKENVQRIKSDKVMDSELKSKMLKAIGMEHSAIKRYIVQGDSLIPVEGGLTAKELSDKVKYLKTNYKGKEVVTPDGNGIVTGKTSFGKHEVNVNGKLKYYTKEQIQAKVDVDEVIRQQKQAISNVKAQPKVQDTIEATPKSVNQSNQTTATMPPTPPIQPPKVAEPASVPPTAESRVKTNTMQQKIEELQTPQGQKFADDFEAVYGVKPDKQSIDNANRMLNEDFDGTLNRILRDGVQSKEDNLAAWAIFKGLAKEGRFDEADMLISRIRPEITNYAQIIQSMSAVPKNTLEGKIAFGKKIADGVLKEMELTNAPKYREAMKTVEAVQGAINKNLNLLDINLQLFADTVDKELKKVMGKLYKKDYIDSIMNVINKNKTSNNELSPVMMQRIADAIKQKYELPSFGADDIEKLTKMFDELETLPKGEWAYRAQMDRIDNVLRSKIPKEMADRLAAYQFINLYGNTLTPMKILGGNITSTAMTHVKDILRHAIDRVLPGKTVTELPSLKTKGKSLFKGTKEVWKDYRNEVDTDIFLQSYDLDMRHGITFQNKLMREAEKLTKLGMAMMERPWKYAIYEDELRMLMKKANVSEPTKEMMETAIEKGNSVMFANRNIATDWIENFRRGMNKVGNTFLNKLPGINIKDTGRFGVGNLVQPVIKTPINMGITAFRYSPLSPFASFKNGKFDRALFVDNMAKAIIGSVFGMGVGYAGKQAGVISGGLPTDAEARKFGEEAGRQPYAFNFGGKSFDVSYIQPFGMLISFGAEYASENKNKQPIVAAMDSLLNQGMLQGFAKLLGKQAIGSGSMSENIVDAITSGANTMVPFSSFQNQISKSIDTYQREAKDDNVFTRNLINRVQQRTPFRLMMPPKINTTGEKLKEDSLLNTWLFPGKVKDIKQDATTKELMRLYEQANETKQFPSVAKEKITYKESKNAKSVAKELTPQEQSQFQEMLGKANMQAVSQAMNKREYINANDKQKAEILSKAMSDAKQKIETEFLRLSNIREYVPKQKTRRSDGRR